MPAPKQRGAKPPSINDGKVQQLLTALRYGNYMDAACAAAGVGVTTVYRWINEGQDESQRIASGEEPNPHKANYVEIMEAIQKARGEAEARNVAVIQKAAQDGTWQASAWWLERSRPQKWGRYTRTEISGPNEGPLQMNVTSDDLENLIAQILGEQDGPESR